MNFWWDVTIPERGCLFWNRCTLMEKSHIYKNLQIIIMINYITIINHLIIRSIIYKNYLHTITYKIYLYTYIFIHMQILGIFLNFSLVVVFLLKVVFWVFFCILFSKSYTVWETFCVRIPLRVSLIRDCLMD